MTAVVVGSTMVVVVDAGGVVATVGGGAEMIGGSGDNDAGGCESELKAAHDGSARRTTNSGTHRLPIGFDATRCHLTVVCGPTAVTWMVRTGPLA
jgi:hypothetical protein